MVLDREDSDDSDGDGENALPALNASELAVTRSMHFPLQTAMVPLHLSKLGC